MSGLGDPWVLYDELVAGIPEDLLVQDCLVGLHWVLVRSEGTGMAMTPSEGVLRHGLGANLRGRSVRGLARSAKSWNFLEAAIGIAAMNSWYNSPSVLTGPWLGGAGKASDSNLFEEWEERLVGKKVSVIGHFPGLEKLAERSTLSILERKPHGTDFPDPACEYLLPGQDVVVATGTTLMNKTLPRLLALSGDAEFALTGPTTPLSAILFRHGVTQLAGSVVLAIHESEVWQHVSEGGDRSVFKHGTRMVRFSPGDAL
jgi:uncharacterized protein